MQKTTSPERYMSGLCEHSSRFHCHESNRPQMTRKVQQGNTALKTKKHYEKNILNRNKYGNRLATFQKPCLLSVGNIPM